MAEVYWIRLPEHTDMTCEGYIGVTRHNAKFRFAQHIQDANRKEVAKWHFTRAIKKYGNKLICQTLVIAEEEYCYDLEFKLRPENNIGWNMAAGGQRPIRNPESYGDEWKQKLREHNLGKIHSEETLKKLSDLSKSCWADPVYLERQRQIIESKKVSRITMPRFWRFGKKSSLTPIADKLFNLYKENPLQPMRILIEMLGLPQTNKSAGIQMARRFRGGWNPSEDADWIKEFKGDLIVT